MFCNFYFFVYKYYIKYIHFLVTQYLLCEIIKYKITHYTYTCIAQITNHYVTFFLVMGNILYKKVAFSSTSCGGGGLLSIKLALILNNTFYCWQRQRIICPQHLDVIQTPGILADNYPNEASLYSTCLPPRTIAAFNICCEIKSYEEIVTWLQKW